MSDNNQFPHGQISPDDKGEVRVLMVADTDHNVVRIGFEEAINWFALDVQAAEEFVRLLEEKIDELKAGPLIIQFPK